MLDPSILTPLHPHSHEIQDSGVVPLPILDSEEGETGTGPEG